MKQVGPQNAGTEYTLGCGVGNMNVAETRGQRNGRYQLHTSSLSFSAASFPRTNMCHQT